VNESPTILIVDDSPTNVALVESVLAAEGFRTLTAHDGAAAVAITRDALPDLILLDVLMPGESGFETCARLKSDAATAGIPIIFLSSLDDVKNKVTGLKIGGVDYISKPVHGEEVLARVRVHLRLSEINRSLVRESRVRLEQLRDAQQAILVRPEDCPEASFSVYYRALEEVGGDFYDVIQIAPGVYSYFVADISGHGVSASFLTAAIKALLRQYTGPMFSPEDTMRGIDSVMRQLFGEEQYLTACYAHLNRNTRRLSVVNAGHPPMFLVSADGTVTMVDLDSEPLGVFSSTVIQRKDLRVRPGDRFVLYSDGMIESSAGAARREGLDQLVSACVRHRAVPLPEMASLVVGDLRPDDVAVEDDLLLLVVDGGA
jgi:phosphoserine phosphatase RsbU/P